MLKINIQLFGGRGADSGYGQGYHTGGGGHGPTHFYDKTAQFKGMTLHTFENAVRDKSVEYMAGFDANGKLVVAGTSQNKGAVAIPTGHPEFSKVVTLTHNHPYGGGRIIGGSFSGADIQTHLSLGLTETRAVSNGPNEHTYIFRKKNGIKQNVKKMTNYAISFNSRYSATANKSLASAKNKAAARGKSLNGRDNQVFIGAAKRIWKNAHVERFGYEYIDVPKAHW